jgi:cell division septation protein DedD
LGSFEGAQAQVKAQNLQKRIKKDYGLNAQILTSEKEKLSRVVLTGYADKNSASVACSELRKKSGLSGAFVRAI